jgi:hypothetical protein
VAEVDFEFVAGEVVADDWLEELELELLPVVRFCSWIFFKDE